MANPQLERATHAALLAWGHSLYQRERFDEAAVFLRLVRAVDPDNRAALKLLASCQHRQGYKRQATQLYRELLRLDPDQPDVLVNLGEILVAQVRYLEALELFERCVALDPSYDNPHAQRARALIMQVQEQLQNR